MRRPELTVEQILAWADDYHARWGRWPTRNSGRIEGSLGETWNAVDLALQRNGRGLTVKGSLALLLVKERGARSKHYLPNFSTAHLLDWADAFHRRNGRWPQSLDGAIPEARGETWLAVQQALVQGSRGFRGGSSLAQFLARHRGRRNPAALPRLTVQGILRWSDAHHDRTGAWPTRDAGPVVDAVRQAVAIPPSLALRSTRVAVPTTTGAGEPFRVYVSKAVSLVEIS